MAKRYVVKASNGSFATGVNADFTHSFASDRVDPSGLIGYSAEEVKHLPKRMVEEMFDVVDMTGDSTVEAATAAPGEKRSVTTKPKSSAKR